MSVHDWGYHWRWYWAINGITLSSISYTTIARLRLHTNFVQGKYGLLMDSLLSVRMFGADGKIITVSAHSHPDLWWGILGAGANFGVITSATYKVHPLVDNGDVFIADFILPPERSREYFDMVEANYSDMPANLAQITIASWNQSTNSVSLSIYVSP